MVDEFSKKSNMEKSSVSPFLFRQTQRARLVNRNIHSRLCQFCRSCRLIPPLPSLREKTIPNHISQRVFHLNPDSYSSKFLILFLNFLFRASYKPHALRPFHGVLQIYRISPIATACELFFPVASQERKNS